MTELHDANIRFRELFTDMRPERRICRIDKSEFADYLAKSRHNHRGRDRKSQQITNKLTEGYQ